MKKEHLLLLDFQIILYLKTERVKKKNVLSNHYHHMIPAWIIKQVLLTIYFTAMPPGLKSKHCAVHCANTCTDIASAVRNLLIGID